jgi:hypothetical protein
VKACQSPNYKPYVRHGLRAVDLRESAPQVGETQEEYDRHVELVESVLPARHRRERNGGRGLGQALWRRRRLFGSRAHLETLGFYLELEKAARWGLCRASVQDLSFSTWFLFNDAKHPRLERTTDRLDQRLVLVAQAYLNESLKELVDLGVWQKQPYSPAFLEQPPEVIGNALLGASVVRQRMQQGQDKDMKPADLFDWDLKPSEPKSVLLAVWEQAGNRVPDPRREEDFALHLRLIEAAFLGDRDAGFGLAGSAGVTPAVEPRGLGQAGETPALPPLDLHVAQFKATYPELYQAVRTLAETTWQRLQVFVGQAEKEAKELRETLERAAAGTLEPGEKSLRERWQEARDKRLAMVPPDPFDEVLWAAIKPVLEKAMAEQQKREDGGLKPEGGTQKQKPEVRNQKSESGAPESRIPSPEEEDELDPMEVRSRLERLIGVFLCSEAFQTFKPIEECNRRVEEAFQALERSLQDVLPPIEGIGSQQSAVGSSP